MTTLNIHAGVIILAVLTVLFTVMAISAWRQSSSDSALFCMFLAVIGFLWARYESNPETERDRIAERAAKQEEKRRQETPHVIREADGCKVYAFLSGDRWHYFTRCPGERTVTDTAYEECTGSGKTRSCKEKHSSIETKG